MFFKAVSRKDYEAVLEQLKQARAIIDQDQSTIAELEGMVAKLQEEKRGLSTELDLVAVGKTREGALSLKVSKLTEELRVAHPELQQAAFQAAGELRSLKSQLRERDQVIAELRGDRELLLARIQDLEKVVGA